MLRCIILLEKGAFFSMEPDKENLRAGIEALRERIKRACEKAARPENSVRLIAVTKTHPVETVQALIDLGVRDIGESRVQEIEEKAPLLSGDFLLHMVGHVQTNKAARLLAHVKWIQSIDREKLVSRIESCHTGPSKLWALVEVNTSGEVSKSGCAPQECRVLCERVRRSSALEFCGLMTVGPREGGESAVRASFALLRRLGEACRDLAEDFQLSMGMSGDFEWAIEEGSTMIRVGTALLGERQQ
jgi:pyridoxal phosphate enzyme (YggS family)